MRAKYVAIHHATGRGVAERWFEQYHTRAGTWYDSKKEQIQKSILALGDHARIDDIAEVIGNKSWTHITCEGCRAEVAEAVAIGEYEPKSYCETCLREAVSILDIAHGATTR